MKEWVNTETVYSARREADLVMTSIVYVKYWEELDRFPVKFAKTLADFEINDLAAFPPLFCYNS